MPNKTNRTAQNKEAVQTTIRNQLVCFFRRESTATAEHVDKTDSDAAINIQNQVGFLFGGHLLHGKGKLLYAGENKH